MSMHCIRLCHALNVIPVVLLVHLITVFLSSLLSLPPPPSSILAGPGLGRIPAVFSFRLAPITTRSALWRRRSRPRTWPGTRTARRRTSPSRKKNEEMRTTNSVQRMNEEEKTVCFNFSAQLLTASAFPFCVAPPVSATTCRPYRKPILRSPHRRGISST